MISLSRESIVTAESVKQQARPEAGQWPEVDRVDVEHQEMETSEPRRWTTWLSQPHDVTAAKALLGVSESMFVSSCTYAFLSQTEIDSHLYFREMLLRP